MSTIERDPALKWNPLPEHGSQASIVPRQWIVHTFVDSVRMTTDKMQDYFEFSSDLESHTILGWAEHQQLMDFDRKADANYKANRFQIGDVWYGAISTETEDDGDPEGKPWNAYQIKELIRFGVWLNRTFGIPPVLPKNWNDPGMGYHSLHPLIWTPHRGKTCPGSTRIKQFKEVVLPGIRAALKPKPTTPPEDDMPKPLLVRMDAKDTAVLYMSSDRTIHWVRSTEALQGYQLDMQMNGLSPDVCVLSKIEDDKGVIDELYDFVINLPAIGDLPPHLDQVWVGPRIT